MGKHTGTQHTEDKKNYKKNCRAKYRVSSALMVQEVSNKKLLTSSISIEEFHPKNLFQLRGRIVYNCHSDELQPLPWKKV